jgi:serine/threonine protein kinase
MAVVALPPQASQQTQEEDDSPTRRKKRALSDAAWPPAVATPKAAKVLPMIEHLRAALVCVDDTDVLTSLIDELVARRAELELKAKLSRTDTSRLPCVPVVDDDGKTPSALGTLGNWTICRELGFGRFASVYSAKNVSNGCMEAVKVISKKELCSEDDWKNLRNEYAAMSKVVPHPHIACLTGAFQSETKVYFFMDLAQGKDLFAFIKLRMQNRTLSTVVNTDAIASITQSVSSALQHCHELGICHRDLKPENVIVGMNYMAKLVDFGCACRRDECVAECVGTIPFIAPECLAAAPLDGAPSDIFSLGVLVLEMKCGLGALTKTLAWEDQLPSMHECSSQLRSLFANPKAGVKIVRGKLGMNPEEETSWTNMLAPEPAHRPTAEHAWPSAENKFRSFSAQN